MAYTITSPLPGTVWEIKVEVGQEISEDEVVLILEAMKMENEILSDDAGVVKSILVNKGDLVKAGESLIEIE